MACPVELAAQALVLRERFSEGRISGTALARQSRDGGAIFGPDEHAHVLRGHACFLCNRAPTELAQARRSVAMRVHERKQFRLPLRGAPTSTAHHCPPFSCSRAASSRALTSSITSGFATAKALSRMPAA